RRLAGFAAANIQVSSGNELANAFKASHRARRREKREQVIEAAHIRPGRHEAAREDPFDFRREDQPGPASMLTRRRPLNRPEQRTNAPAVASDQQPLLFLIPEREGELAAQPFEHLFAMLLPEMRKQLGVGVGAKDVPLGFEFFALLGIIEQLAVEYDMDGA